MIIIAATIIISLSNTNIISKAQTAVDETNLANIRDAAALKYADIKTGAISIDPDKTIGEQIRDLLIEDGIITEDQTIVINNSGGLEEIVNVKSTLNGGNWNYYWQIGYSPKINYFGALPLTTVIPNFVEGIRVEIIDFEEFGSSRDTSIVETIKLSYGISDIFHLRSFSNLKMIYIPESVVSISENAFSECPKLSMIIIDKPTGSISGAPWGADVEDWQIIWSDTKENLTSGERE